MAKKKAKRPQRRSGPSDRARGSASPRVAQLLHELNVYGEEITVQNEQLLRAQVEIEAARDRYADLYDLAPIGYVTLDAHGIIIDINLVAAELLGHDRQFLNGMTIFGVVAESHRAALRDFLRMCAGSNGRVLPSVDVRLRHLKHLVRITARSVVGPQPPTRIFAAMLDMTEEDRLAVERAQALAQAKHRATQLAQEVIDRERAERTVKRVLEQIVNVQEEERRRLARNLHDHLGQQLTALRFSIGALRDMKLTSPDALRDRVDALDRMVAQLDKDLDLLVWDLRPSTLDEMGLAPAIEQLVRQWSSATGVPADFHASSGVTKRMPAEVESHMYRIAQEALNNVSKHAKAACVSVVLDVRHGQMVLTIEDDGRGFDVDRVAAARGSHGGFGVIGMQERAALVGGNVAIESAAGKGTTVLVRVPLKL